MSERGQRILLAGGGHSHVEVLRRFALQPDATIALTLISPDPATVYSGMLPGLVAGHYTPTEAHISLAPLAQWAGARFVCDRIVELDLYTKTALLASGDREAFDFISVDVGSLPDMTARGAREHALGVKPVERFLDASDLLRAEALAGHVQTIAVVGGGAGGVEVLLAMQYRLHALMGASAPRFALVTDQSQVLPQHPRMIRTRFGRLLVERGVVLHLSSGVTAMEAGTLIVAHGRRVAADRVVWATSAAAQPWMAASGLACDERGFILLDAHLRSPSHPFVFAAGDCAGQPAHPRPKSGVFAVRQGPPLAANLRCAVRKQPLATYTPQRASLALISTGGKHALASRGPFAIEGDWVWRWKDRIDRRFVARYIPPVSQPAASASD